MKIAYVGFLALPENINIRENISLFDYDVIVVDSKVLRQSYNFEFDGLPGPSGIIESRDFSHMESDVEKMAKDIEDFLKNGKYVFFVMPENYTIRSSTPNGKVKQPSSIMPLELRPASTVNEVGERIEIKTQNTRIARLGRSLTGYFKYRAYTESANMIGFAFIKDTSRIVGATTNRYGERFVILPSLEIAAGNQKEIYDAILTYIEEGDDKKEEISIPEWLSDLKTDYETQKSVELQEKNKTLSDTVLHIEAIEGEINKNKKYKSVLADTGESLETTVLEMLNILGFSGELGEKGRDDIIAKYDNQHFVIEVKGVAKSAAEKYAAQLEKWASIYKENNDITPKAILIVNAFKDLPLNQRKEAVFPNQMLAYSVGRGHCLMTTTQLFCIFMEFNFEEAYDR